MSGSQMIDFLKDSPAYKWMTEDAYKEGFEQGLAEGRELALIERSRQTIITLVTNRFPKWAGMAKKQVQDVKDLPTLVEAITFIALAKDAEEVGNALASLDNEE